MNFVSLIGVVVDEDSSTVGETALSGDETSTEGEITSFAIKETCCLCIIYKNNLGRLWRIPILIVFLIKSNILITIFFIHMD